MTVNYDYGNLGKIKVTDLPGLTKWIGAIRRNEWIAPDLHNLIIIKKEGQSGKWYVEIGYGGVKVDKKINKFYPEDKIVQEFFIELSKYVEPIAFFVFYEEFPMVQEHGMFSKDKNTYAWMIHAKNGNLQIDKLKLIKTNTIKIERKK